MENPEIVGSLGETASEKLRKLIAKNTQIILTHQDPLTGLFPASTVDRRVEEGHYGDAWVRDSAAVIKGLLYLRKFTADIELKEKLTEAAQRSLNGILELVSQEKWQRAFGQLIINEGNYTRLTEEAPPIHLKTSGEICPWPHQNQPDSWGAFLIVVSLAHEQGIFEPNATQRRVFESIVRYLVNIKVEKFEASSMWEDREVRNPPSISTALIVGEGLWRVKGLYEKNGESAYEKELIKIVERRVNAVESFVAQNYPADITWPEGHQSTADLATLVAFSYSDRGNLSLTRYMHLANLELGNGDLPGKIRFRGDPYYNHEGNEAVWFMALPLEAIAFLRKSLRALGENNLSEALRFRDMAFRRLARAVAVGEQYGYYPELFIVEEGRLVPNENDLLWNRALMVDAASLEIEVEKCLASSQL